MCRSRVHAQPVDADLHSTEQLQLQARRGDDDVGFEFLAALQANSLLRECVDLAFTLSPSTLTCIPPSSFSFKPVAVTMMSASSSSPPFRRIPFSVNVSISRSRSARRR